MKQVMGHDKAGFGCRMGMTHLYRELLVENLAIFGGYCQIIGRGRNCGMVLLFLVFGWAFTLCPLFWGWGIQFSQCWVVL